MDDIESALERLENIRTVEPIASALRTISLGSWQAALKRRSSVHRYGEELLALLPTLLSHLPGASPGRAIVPSPARRPLTVVIGSERGLCGRFNVAVVKATMHHLRQFDEADIKARVIALGSKATRGLEREAYPPAQSRPLSVTALPSPDLASELTQTWLAQLEVGEIDAVEVIYNRYHSPGRYDTAMVRLLPPQLGPDEVEGAPEAPWPPVIVETDPQRLYARIIAQGVAIHFYGLLLDSAAAEHSVRYQLMEGATKNAERLIEELTLVVQTARRQAITQEMQELAAGAGLLGRRE